MFGMRRRDFVALLGGAGAMWPLAEHAQQPTMPVVGFLGSVLPDSSAALMRDAFRQGLKDIGYIRCFKARAERDLDAAFATSSTREVEAVWSKPIHPPPEQVIALRGPLSRSPRSTRSTSSPRSRPHELWHQVVKRLASAGVYATGFSSEPADLRRCSRDQWLIAFEDAIAAKRLELLKEIAPGVTRAGVLRDPAIAAEIGQFAAIQAVGPIGMELSVISTRGDVGAVENAVEAFARRSSGGLVVTGSPFAANNAVTFLLAELGAKQLGLLRELVPAAMRIGLLVNPNNSTSEAQTSDVVAAASGVGATIDVLRASDSHGIEAAFATLVP